MNEQTQIRATSAPWWRGVELIFRKGDQFGTGIVFVEKSPAAEIIGPTCEISMDEAQTLMDDLWRCGLRPTEGAGSSGAMRATENHISDLRKIIFKTMEIE